VNSSCCGCARACMRLGVSVTKGGGYGEAYENASDVGAGLLVAQAAK
jgi:hypothetical protein